MLSRDANSTGSAVRSVQEMLRNLGYHSRDLSKSPPASEPLEPDGIFGAKTESAVIDFQRSEGLLADGVVGPSTMEVLQDAYSRRVLELASPGVDVTLGMPDRHTFERVPADLHDGEGYQQLSLRNDVADAYMTVYETVRQAGGVLTSSGGIRSIHTPGSRSRSATSLHYLGRALDLYIYSGMVDPKSDPYVIEREEERIYRVHARCSKDNNAEARPPEKTSIKNCISYGDRTRGQAVEGHFLDLTALFQKHGFERIRARRRFEERASMMGAEWWHFQYEKGLVKGVSTFGHELLKVYSRDTVEGTPPWRCRDRVWRVNWS